MWDLPRCRIWSSCIRRSGHWRACAWRGSRSIWRGCACDRTLFRSWTPRRSISWRSWRNWTYMTTSWRALETLWINLSIWGELPSVRTMLLLVCGNRNAYCGCVRWWIYCSTLDLSFNLLRSVPDRLEFLHSLETIYFVQNKISKISGFASCTKLRSLELGGNKIRVRLCLVL